MYDSHIRKTKNTEQNNRYCLNKCDKVKMCLYLFNNIIKGPSVHLNLLNLDCFKKKLRFTFKSHVNVTKSVVQSLKNFRESLISSSKKYCAFVANI